jgi:hypothetical protein
MWTPFNFFIGVWKGSEKGQPGTARKGLKVYSENHFQRVLSE